MQRVGSRVEKGETVTDLEVAAVEEEPNRACLTLEGCQRADEESEDLRILEQIVKEQG